MGKWADDFKPIREPLIKFDSWKALNKWCDEVGARNGCWFIEEQYVLNCYALYRKEKLNDKVAGMFDDYKGCNFEVIREVDPMDKDFDICSLPIWECVVDWKSIFNNSIVEDVILFADEIFVNW